MTVEAIRTTEAVDFLTDREVLASPERIGHVVAEIANTGTYTHTSAELAIGCMQAWRNHAGCADRLSWARLVVRDKRHVCDAAGVADECIAHLREATNGGRIRPAITVFAPDGPGQAGPRIWNDQVVRYAGFPAGDRVEGDPISLDVTRAALALGWQRPRKPYATTTFEVLPLIVESPHEPPSLFDIPGNAVKEVHVRHPEHEAVGKLGLRWYAMPVISSMTLVIGGITYPAAPFGGWYTSYELAEDLGSPDRFDVLSRVANALKLDQSGDFWLDQALLELTRAVHYSYKSDGVMIMDHHRISRRHKQFVAYEQEAHRRVSADPRVAVPPMSTNVLPTFRDEHVDHNKLPAFVKRSTPLYAAM